MRIGLEIQFLKTENTSLVRRMLGLSTRSRKVFVLYNATPQCMESIQRLCVNDGKDYHVEKKGDELHVPDIKRKYKGFWLQAGISQFLSRAMLPEEAVAELVGVYHFSEADLRSQRISHYLRLALEASLFLTLGVLIAPALI